MTKDEQRDVIRRMLQGYELLERERRERVRRTDTAQSIDLLDDAFESELWLRPKPRASSGMIEMQALFQRSRR